MTLIIFLFGLKLKLEKFHLFLPFTLLPASSPLFLPVSLGSDLLHIELFVETTSTQKGGEGGLKTDCSTDKKETPFTSILFLCAW